MPDDQPLRIVRSMYSIGDAATAAKRMPPGPKDEVERDVEDADCGRSEDGGNEELKR